MDDSRSGKKPGRGSAKERSGRPPLQHGPRESHYDPVHLSDNTVKELKATARPGKGDILVKVFADAVAAFAAEDFNEATRLGEQAKHIALRSIAAREFLGLAYYRAGRWSEAARELSAFRRLAGSTEQNPVIADCYRAMHRPDKAIEYCDEVLPGRVDEAVYYEAQIVAAGGLADMRRMDEAIERLEGLDLRPDVAQPHHLRAWYALADLLERRGRYTQARELFEAVAASDQELTDAPERARRLAAK
jgi:tetratricopeptide (TPR) repeat protein